jgi:hypothetical protein
MEEHPGVAVDEGDLALARGRRGEPRIVGEDIGFGVELADVDDRRTVGSLQDRQLDGFPIEADFRRIAHAIPFRVHQI